MLQKRAPEMGAVGLNSTPDSGAVFHADARLLTARKTAGAGIWRRIYGAAFWSRVLERVLGALREPFP